MKRFLAVFFVLFLLVTPSYATTKKPKAGEHGGYGSSYHISRMGTYTVYSPKHASFIGDSVPFGDVVDKRIVRVLGTTTVVVDWFLYGEHNQNMRVSVNFIANEYLPYVHIKGRFQNGARGWPGGGKILQYCHGIDHPNYYPGSRIPGTMPFCQEGSMWDWDHNLEIQVYWTHQTHPHSDNWFVTVQSPVAHKDGGRYTGTYRFTTAAAVAGMDGPARIQEHVFGGFNGVRTVIGV